MLDLRLDLLQTLWQLASVALPLVVILLVQVMVVVLAAVTISFVLMGRDYESAVVSSGFVGFVLGTANAVANMRALVAWYGPAPRAFLVVPLVGAFFIDFTNKIITTFFAGGVIPLPSGRGHGGVLANQL